MTCCLARGLKSALTIETRNQRMIFHMAESCKNPWNGKCSNTNIEVYIQYKDQVLPICRHCWSEIAEKDIEWGQ